MSKDEKYKKMLAKQQKGREAAIAKAKADAAAEVKHQREVEKHNWTLAQQRKIDAKIRARRQR